MLDRLEKLMFDRKNTPEDFSNHHFKLMNVLLKLKCEQTKSYEKCCGIIEALYGSSLE